MYVQLRSYKHILLATRRAAINNVALNGLLYIASTALEAMHVARLGLGKHDCIAY